MLVLGVTSGVRCAVRVVSKLAVGGGGGGGGGGGPKQR